MVKKIKCAMIFVMVLALLPVQVRAEESEENVDQVVNENLEETQMGKETDVKDEALIDDDTEQQEEKTDDKSDQQEEKTDDKPDQQEEEDESTIKKTTGTELTVSVSPSPKVEMVGSKWKIVKNKKYIFSITITNISSSDFEDVKVNGAVHKAYVYPEYLTFYPQNGVTVNDYDCVELPPFVDAEAVVAQLKSGDSITLQAEVVIPVEMGDAAMLSVVAELNRVDTLGYVDYDLQIINEKKPIQENPKSENETKTTTKTVAKTNDKGSTIKTAAKTGDNSSTIVYFGVIALSALTIIVSRKKLYK